MIRQTKTTACLFFAAASLLLAGCGQHKAGTDAASGPKGQTPPEIQQRATQQQANYQNLPPMGTAPAGK